MYTFLLFAHSALRWVFLAFILISLFQAYSGWLGNKSYTKSANTFKTLVVSTIHLQIIIGLILYFVSPITTEFMDNMGASMKDSTLRFYGMEHFIMMLIVAVLITVGSVKSRKKTTDVAKFKTLAIWFTIALLIILITVPSEFSPMQYRPNFRGM